MLGIDLIAIDRIERLAERPWYCALWLHPEELGWLRSRQSAASSLAAVVAAKEAVMKAAGRGFRQGVRPSDVRLHWSPEGRPAATFDGRRFSVSVTHSDGFAAAVALAGEVVR